MHPWEAGKRVWNSCSLPQRGNRLPTLIVSPGVYFCMIKMKAMRYTELHLSTFWLLAMGVFGLVLVVCSVARVPCPPQKARALAQGVAGRVTLGSSGSLGK